LLRNNLRQPAGSAVRTAKRRQDSPLANRDYVLFLVGAFVSSLGSWMQAVALSWTALQLGHGSSFVLGLLGFVSTVPVLIFGVAAGDLADRVDRRRVLLVTQLGGSDAGGCPHGAPGGGTQHRGHVAADRGG